MQHQTNCNVCFISIQKAHNYSCREIKIESCFLFSPWFLVKISINKLAEMLLDYTTSLEFSQVHLTLTFAV